MKIDTDKAWDRIAQLLTNSTKNFNNPPSNCFGTALYVLGDYDSDKPHFADENEMENFLSTCTKKESYLGIVVFYQPDKQLEHAGICIERNLMFHQLGTGMRWEFKYISDYVFKNPFLMKPKFYTI